MSLDERTIEQTRADWGTPPFEDDVAEPCAWCERIDCECGQDDQVTYDDLYAEDIIADRDGDDSWMDTL